MPLRNWQTFWNKKVSEPKCHTLIIDHHHHQHSLQKGDVAINKVSPKVIVAGENWDAANVEAVKAAQEETTFLVHPFDQVR